MKYFKRLGEKRRRGDHESRRERHARSESKTPEPLRLVEWAGAFGDLGTLNPFVVAYSMILQGKPLGSLLMFGIALLGLPAFLRLCPARK